MRPQVMEFNGQWILPNAAPIPITLNNGYRMPGWFDIKSLGDVNLKEDEEGMMKSVELVHKVIDEEIGAGIPADQIVVGGFSQGMTLK
jgi:predicted esterase